MVSSIRTGANVYVKYGYETGAFGTTSTTAADINRTFGLKTSIGSLTLTNNRTELGKLGQIEVADYAFGTQSGTVSINYVLADTITNDLATDIEGSGDIFRAIYGAPASGVYPASGLLGQGKAPTTSESMSIEIGIETSGWGRSEVTEHKTRVLKGAVLNSLSLSTSVGEPVNVSADFSFGIENSPLTSFASPTLVHGTPYTFAHAKLKLRTANNDTLSDDTKVLTLVQDTELTFGLNNELLYGLSSNQAVDTFRKMLDITGRFKVALVDWVLHERLLAQIGKGSTSGTRQPTVVPNDDATAQLELTFTNGNRSIKIELGGVSITDLSVTGLEPVEVLYQEITYRAKTAKITVDTTA